MQLLHSNTEEGQAIPVSTAASLLVLKEVLPESSTPDFVTWNARSSHFCPYHNNNSCHLKKHIIVSRAHSCLLYERPKAPINIPVYISRTKVDETWLRSQKWWVVVLEPTSVFCGNHGPTANIPRWAHQHPERTSTWWMLQTVLRVGFPVDCGSYVWFLVTDLFYHVLHLKTDEWVSVTQAYPTGGRVMGLWIILVVEPT